MILELASVVLVSSILVFFSEEWGNLLKKLFAIRGMKLFIPLIIANCVLIVYQPWVSIVLIGIQHILHQLQQAISNLIPWQMGAQQMAGILILFLLTLIPVWILNYWFKRRSYLGFRRRRLTLLLIWLFCAIVLIVPPV